MPGKGRCSHLYRRQVIKSNRLPPIPPMLDDELFADEDLESLYPAFRRALQRRDYENHLVFDFLRLQLPGLSVYTHSDLWHLVQHHHPRIKLFKEALIVRLPPHTWFILLSGSLLIDGQLYLPNASFGPNQAEVGNWDQMHRNSALLGNGSTSKSTECLTLEPSELLLIDYHCNGLTTATFTGAEPNNMAGNFTYHHSHHHSHNHHHAHHQRQQQQLNHHQQQLHHQLHHVQHSMTGNGGGGRALVSNNNGGGSNQSINSGSNSSAHEQLLHYSTHHMQQQQQQFVNNSTVCPITGNQLQLQYGNIINQTYLQNYMANPLSPITSTIPWMPHQRAASMYSCHSDTTTATNTTSSDSELDLNGLNEGMVDDDDDDVNDEELGKFNLNADELLYNNLLLTNNNNNLINNLINNHKPPSNQLLHLRQVLEKNALDRTDEDNETILNYINSLSAFDKYDQATKKQLASVMILAIIENPFTVILTHNETLDSFCCLIHGTVEHLYATADPYGQNTMHSSKILHPGDIFGITEPTMETIYFEGIMKTLTPFCWFLCVTQLDFYRILSATQLEIIKHEEDGKVTLVTELRKINNQKRGHIIIRGTPERLMAGVLENDTSDPFYIDDFLLTYRVFMSDSTSSTSTQSNSSSQTTTITTTPASTPSQSQSSNQQKAICLIPKSNSQFAHLIKGMEHMCNKLLTWFDDPTLRDKVIRIVLTWINNYYLDFDLIAGNVSSNNQCVQVNNSGQLFLDLFEHKLSSNVSLLTQLRLLHIGLSTKAKTRHINLTRSNRDEEFLHFTIMGGYERGFGIFVSKVDSHSKVEQLGLRRGDQILEVNGINFTIISHAKAIEVLKSTTHLQLTVKYNPFMFKEMISVPDGIRSKKNSLSSALLPFPGTNAVSPVNLRKHSTGTCAGNGNVSSVALNPNASGGKWQLPNHVSGSGIKIKKAIPKFANFISKHLNFNNDDTSLNSDQVDFVKPLGGGRSLSNPDLLSTNSGGSCSGSAIVDMNHFCQIQQHVLRVFNAASGENRYLFIHPETTAREVVMVSVREFGLSSSKSSHSNEQAKSSLNYALYEVSVVPEANNTIKQRRLPDQLNNLAERASIHSRYYIKENTLFGASSSNSGNTNQSSSTNPNQLSDEVSVEILKECPVPITLLSLNTTLLGNELTLLDFNIFRSIEPQSYIFDLFEMDTEHLSDNKLQEFEALSNREMFWVINEILNEPAVIKRVKIIKYFIKIANICRNVRNYNSMFAILCGLGHGSVQRLKQTWEKLSTKYHKIMKTLQILMDPSRNMMHYRRELSSRSAPIIPFFPIVKKDLTFLHLAHMTNTDDQLVNFDKLRMISKEIRAIVNMASQPYVFPSSVPCAGQACVAGVCTAAISKGSQILPEISGGVPLPPPPPTVISGSNVMPKRLFEEALMRKKVRLYLDACFANINYDEDQLLVRSIEIEPGQSSTLNQSQHSQSSSSLKQANGSTCSKDNVNSNTATNNTNTTSTNTGATNGQQRSDSVGKGQGSPTLSSTSSGSSSCRLKFGAESPHQLRKLMSLSEASKPVSKTSKSNHQTNHRTSSAGHIHAPSQHTSSTSSLSNSGNLAHAVTPVANYSANYQQMPPPHSGFSRYSSQSTQTKSSAPASNVGLSSSTVTGCNSSSGNGGNAYRTVTDSSNILLNTVSFNAPLSIESSSVTSLRRLEQLQQLKKLQEQQMYYYNGGGGGNSSGGSSTTGSTSAKCSSPLQRPALPNYDEAMQRQQKLANLVQSSTSNYKTVVRSVSSSSSSNQSGSSVSGSGRTLDDENKVSTV